MLLAHKIRLDPTKEQVEFLKKACGVSRFSWNWALAEWNRQFEAGQKPSGFALQKQFNAIKKEQFPWVFESPKNANQRPFQNLQKAFNTWFKSLKNTSGRKVGRPKFKSRKKNQDSFYLQNDVIRFERYKVKIPLIGWIKTRQLLRFEGKIIGATVSRVADRWFISVQIEVANFKKERIRNDTVGIDLGLTYFAVLSNGKKFKAPKPLKKSLKTLARLQRKFSRQTIQSKRRERTRLKIQKLFCRITDVRNDFLHKLSTNICRDNQTIVIEDLAVSNMMKNHCLARAISDVSWAEFRRQLMYKSEIYECKLVIADQFFASSKICSNCGAKKEQLPLVDRNWQCKSCNMSHDRDINAAINLCSLGLRDHARGLDTAQAPRLKRELIINES